MKSILVSRLPCLVGISMTHYVLFPCTALFGVSCNVESGVSMGFYFLPLSITVRGRCCFLFQPS